MFGDKKIALELLTVGANIDEPDKSGQTPLWRVVGLGDHEMTEFLLSHGASIARRGTFHSKLCAHLRSDVEVHVDLSKYMEEPMWSVASRHSDMPCELLYKLLPDRHDVNNVDVYGLTALHRVCTKGRADLATALLLRGAGIEKPDRLGATPLIQVARQTSSVEHTELLTLLIHKGANINARDSTSWTALMWAVQKGDCNQVDILIRNGADVNAVATREGLKGLKTTTDRLGHWRCVRDTALTIAALIVNVPVQGEMINLLLDHGADAELAHELLQN